MSRDWWKWAVLGACIAGSAAVLAGGAVLGRDLGRFHRLTLRLESDGEPKAGADAEAAQARACAVVSERLVQLGLTDFAVYPAGTDGLVVEAAREKPAMVERIKRCISRRGALSLHLVHKDNAALVAGLWERSVAPPGLRIAEALEGGETARYYVADNEKMAAGYQDWSPLTDVPTGYEIRLLRKDLAGVAHYSPFFVQIEADLPGIGMEKASARTGGGGERFVDMTFDASNKHALRRITADYVSGGRKNVDGEIERSLALAYDGVLVGVFPVKTVVYDGRLSVGAPESPSEARDMSYVLKSGSLPGPVSVESDDTADPLLGAGAARATWLAGALFLFVAGVLLVARRAWGVVAACWALVSVLAIPFGVFVVAGFLGTVSRQYGRGELLTVPPFTPAAAAGIFAGMVLALDAVLSALDRVRDSLSLPKPYKAAMASGLEKARTASLKKLAMIAFAALPLLVFGNPHTRTFAMFLWGGILACMIAGGLNVPFMAARIAAKRMESSGRTIPGVIGDTRGVLATRGKVVALISVAAPALVWIAVGARLFNSSGCILKEEFTWGAGVHFGVLAGMAAAALAGVAALAIALAAVLRTGFGAAAAAAVCFDVLTAGGVCLLSGGRIGGVFIACLLCAAFVSMTMCTGVLQYIHGCFNDPDIRRNRTPAEIVGFATGRSFRSVVLVAIPGVVSGAAVALLGAGDLASAGVLLLAGFLCGIFSSLAIAPVIVLRSAARETTAR